MDSILDRLKNYFIKSPVLRTAFQLSSSYLSGVHISLKEKRIKHHFIIPLKETVVEPSFNKKNIIDESFLGERIKEGMKELHLTNNNISCLIPETCLKVFVFSFTSLPPSQREREKIIQWRIRKQAPLLPEDFRFSYNVIKSNKENKVLVSLAKGSVIQEYEDFFAKAGLKVGVVGVPTFSLLNLVAGERHKNLMVINFEEDYISLTAVLNSEIVLYRLKPFVSGGKTRLSFSQKMENIVQEIENTVHFLEDREKMKIESFWIRLGLLEPEGEVLSVLREKLSLPLKGIEASRAFGLNFRQTQILSPLIGQISCW